MAQQSPGTSANMSAGSSQATGSLTIPRAPRAQNSEPGFRFNMRGAFSDLVVAPPVSSRKSLGGASRSQQQQPQPGSSPSVNSQSPRVTCGQQSRSPSESNSVRMMGSPGPRRSLRMSAGCGGCSTNLVPPSRRATLPHSPSQQLRQPQQQQQHHQQNARAFGCSDNEPFRRVAQQAPQPPSARHSFGRWLARSRSAEQALGISGIATAGASGATCEDDRQREGSPTPRQGTANSSSHLPHLQQQQQQQKSQSMAALGAQRQTPKLPSSRIPTRSVSPASRKASPSRAPSSPRSGNRRIVLISLPVASNASTTLPNSPTMQRSPVPSGSSTIGSMSSMPTGSMAIPIGSMTGSIPMSPSRASEITAMATSSSAAVTRTSSPCGLPPVATVLSSTGGMQSGGSVTFWTDPKSPGEVSRSIRPPSSPPPQVSSACSRQLSPQTPPWSYRWRSSSPHRDGMPFPHKASLGKLGVPLAFQAPPNSRSTIGCTTASAVASGMGKTKTGSAVVGCGTPGLAKRAAVLAGASALHSSSPFSTEKSPFTAEKEVMEERQANREKKDDEADRAEEVMLNMSTPGMTPRRLVFEEKSPLVERAFPTTSCPRLSSRPPSQRTSSCSWSTQAPCNKPLGVAPTELDMLREWLGQLERRITLQEVCFTGAAAAEVLQPLFAALALTKRGLSALERS
mmetsp:Transcript_58608/g.116230  ORF Transcript_58608/g.116230 Transcript_58608/m.116230 type:complete len:683 (-) Transcript_58608:61-2109(-)